MKIWIVAEVILRGGVRVDLEAPKMGIFEAETAMEAAKKYADDRGTALASSHLAVVEFRPRIFKGVRTISAYEVTQIGLEAGDVEDVFTVRHPKSSSLDDPRRVEAPKEPR